MSNLTQEINQKLDSKINDLETQVKHLSVLNDKYKVELAIIKRHKFDQKHEHLSSLQIGLFDEAIL